MSAPVTARLVPAAAPIIGVTSVGLVANTKAPVPVAPVDVTPSIVGWPEIVGEVSNTNFPVPVAPVEVTPSIVGCPVMVGATDMTTVAPVPVKPVIALLLTLKLLPAPAVLNVLFVSVSVVARPM